MRRFFQAIDQLLRGKLTSAESLAAGRIDGRTGELVGIGVVLGCAYGAAMGLYAVLRPGNPSFLQLVASMLKVPWLFLLTLVVTYPSLYVVSALFDSRLRHAETLRLLLISVCVHLALLASLGPVTAFFTLSTESYDFMKVLNVLFFAVSGFAGLGFLLRALQRVFGTATTGTLPPARVTALTEGFPPEEHPRRLPPATEPNRAPRRVFTIWVVIYGAVGAQMGWILRPFIGSPELEFTWLRERESNFFEAFFQALGRLFS